MKNSLICLFLPLLLSSCQIYKSKFDCPPGKGVPCTSVTEIESMVVETPEGPDLFSGHYSGCGKERHCYSGEYSLKRVLIKDKDGKNGWCYHYFYLPEVL